MELYRICSEEHAEGLTASGCENRWNRGGQFVIYACGSRSLATLEMVVRRNSILPYSTYRMMVLSISAEANLVNQILLEDLPDNWRTMAGRPALQVIGASWYVSSESLVLKVPSVVIPEEFNYVLKTNHREFQEHVKLIGSEPYYWDERLATFLSL